MHGPHSMVGKARARRSRVSSLHPQGARSQLHVLVWLGSEAPP